MSDRTVPALAAAMRASKLSAFWIDAFCIPTLQPMRGATLESMGFIYSLAAEVIVSLSEHTFPVLEELSRSDKLSNQNLFKLEQDAWAKSVWTYQEVVNSQMLYFVSSHRASEIVIDGSHVLNSIGYSLKQYQDAHQLSELDICRDFPVLDILLDLIADWMMAGYTERSALQVISNLDRRYSSAPENYFYSAIGSVTQQPSERYSATVAALADTFMNICEQKNDYSFIYSSAARDQRIGKAWRPERGPLRSVLPWHSYGGAQRGHTDSEGLWLDDMVLLEPSACVASPAKQDILDWLRAARVSLPHSVDIAEDIIAEYLFPCLRTMGFTGTSQYISTEHGLFYLQNSLHSKDDTELLVATNIGWRFGNPGLAKRVTEGKAVYTPGVFVGNIGTEKPCSVLVE